MGQHGQQKKRHDIGDLDGRVNGRACRILIGIPYRIARDGSLVRFRALHMLYSIGIGKTILEAFLGIIPCTAAGGHGNRHEKPIDDNAEK